MRLNPSTIKESTWIFKRSKGMHYETGVNRIDFHRNHERRKVKEENLIVLIRLIIIPLCLCFWYGLYKGVRLIIHWFF